MRLVSLLAVALLGCEQTTLVHAPYVTGIEPTDWAAGQMPAISILGGNFDLSIASRFDRGRVELEPDFQALLGGVPFRELARQSNTRLTGVPPLLPVGLHSLEVRTPHGHAALRDAVRVTPAPDGGQTADGAPGDPGGDPSHGDPVGDPGHGDPVGDPGHGDPVGDPSYGDPGWGDPGIGPPATSFQDNFDDGALGADWQPYISGPCCQVTETTEVCFYVDTTGACSCSLTSTGVFDLNDSSVAIAIAPISNFEPQLSFYLAVLLDADTWAELRFRDDLFESRVTVYGAEVFFASSSYPPDPYYWRIRETGGTTYFESSLDNATWELEADTPTVFPVSAVRVRFGYDTDSALPRDISIGVSAYNP